MVLAYHIIYSMYGFWLPNDPRGSWSTFVGSWELFRTGGAATKVNDPRSRASDKHDRKLRLDIKERLKYAPVILTGQQALSIAQAFADTAHRAGYLIHALAILPGHGHIVLGRHQYDVEQMVRRLKQAAGLKLKNEGLHPFADKVGRRGALPSAFGTGMWKCFIDSEEYLRAAVKYVKENPIKEGKKMQDWSFVTPLPGANV